MRSIAQPYTPVTTMVNTRVAKISSGKEWIPKKESSARPMAHR
jgi:hypothetical protein